MNRYLRCYAEISLEAIGHNIREVKKRLPEGVKLLGVVKRTPTATVPFR